MSYKYACKDAVNNTFSELLFIDNGDYGTVSYFVKRANYKFANGFTYSNGVYTLNNTNVINRINFASSQDMANLSNAHYTCFNSNGVCEKINYVYYTDTDGYDGLADANENYGEIDNYTLYYIELTNGEDISDALHNMYYVNNKSSVIKQGIDAWYKKYIYSYDSYVDDTVYCDDKTITTTGNFSPNGSITQKYYYNDEYHMYPLFNKFNNYSSTDLSCSSLINKYSVSNNSAKLDYKVALPTVAEMNLLNNNKARATTSATGGFALIEKSTLNETVGINYDGEFATGIRWNIRPYISLKKNAGYKVGDGSMASPYIVVTN